MDKTNARQLAELREEEAQDQINEFFTKRRNEVFLRLEPAAAEKIAGCVLTRYELIEVVKHWAHVILDTFWNQTHDGECGGLFEMGRDNFARQRMKEFKVYLGNNEREKAITEVEEEFARDKDPKECKAFFRRFYKGRYPNPKD